MKTYVVNIPFAGYLSVEVQAENEKDAFENGWDVINSSEPDMKFKKEDVGVYCREWGMHKHLSEGNIDHTGCNSYYVEEL